MDAIEIHLVLGPKKKSVQGDSKALSHEKSIDIEDWGFRLSVKADLAKAKSPNSQGSGNQADVTDITLKKSLDRSSTALMRLVASGDELTEATLHMLHRIHLNVRVTLRLTDVKVTDYKIDVQDGDNAVTFKETFSLSFNKIRVEYQARAAARGAGKSGGGTRSFEIKLT